MSMMIKKAVGAAVLASMSMAVAVAADIDLYGGGATFPAVPYVGTAFQPSARLSTVLGNSAGTGHPVAAISAGIFDSYIANTVAPLKVGVSYCQTGSGGGKTVLLGAPALPQGNADVACGSYSPGPALGGFSSVNDRPNYVGTDSPISTADYTNFLTNVPSKTAIVQVPTLVGAVTLPFRNSDVVGTLNLTTDDVCRIFSRTYTDWNQIPGAGLPSKAITIVFRSDNSGTSFAFTNFLARNCNAANGGPIADRSTNVGYYQTNQTYLTAAGGLYAPGTFKAVSGNASVVATVNGNDGHIGYADPGDVQALGGTYSHVNGQDPMTFTSPAFAAADLLVDTVVSATATATTGLPATSAAPVSSGALTVINPATVVSSGYPIFAPTYLLFYAAGNETSDVGGNPDTFIALQDLMNFIYDYPSLGTGPTPWSPARPVLPVGYAYVDDTNIGPAVQTAISLIN